VRVLLINIDSKRMPNLALKKVERYHLDRGDQVEWDMPLMAPKADKIYVSCIFKENRSQAEEYHKWKEYAEQRCAVYIGGTGYSLTYELPHEIDIIKPHINFGFTTRGCVRRCGFCVVPQKEGPLRVVGDLLDLWDGRARDITLLDNNILGLPEHFFKITGQALEHNIRLDFNQGLDHRLLTPEIVGTLKKVRHKDYHFAFDHPSMRDSVVRAIEMLTAEGIKRSIWYVLVGYNTTFEEDLQRLNLLRDMDQRAFVQRYRMANKYIPLARWANQRQMFMGMTYEQFLKHPAKRKYYESFEVPA
jgi:hypothetical protein